jgi:hypothetical protein
MCAMPGGKSAGLCRGWNTTQLRISKPENAKRFVPCDDSRDLNGNYTVGRRRLPEISGATRNLRSQNVRLKGLERRADSSCIHEGAMRD